MHEVPCSFLCRVKDNVALRGPGGASPWRPPPCTRVSYAMRSSAAWARRTIPACCRSRSAWCSIATGKTRKDGTPDVLVLITNRLDLDAELLAVAYRYRWAVELFFRWVKCVLGCRHLLSQGMNGVRIQVYTAFIASLLISLWVGRAPTKRTYEMLCFYLSGWATEAELITHIDRLHLKAPPPCKN